jgi:hypothetical protein
VPDRGHELGERHARAERFAQVPIEPRAARHLGLGAAEEGRAHQPARCREIDFLERKPDQAERQVNRGRLGERLAEREVERQRAFRRAGQVVAGLHDP